MNSKFRFALIHRSCPKEAIPPELNVVGVNELIGDDENNAPKPRWTFVAK